MENRGFTLIETIIYIALMALLIGGGVVTAFYVTDSAQKNKSDVNIQAEGNFILRKIEWAMSGASSIIVGATLSITKPSLPPAQNPLVFSLNGSNMQLTRGTGAAQNLNSSNVSVSALSFTDIPASGGTPQGVTINFTVNNKPFTLTKYLRK